MVSKGDRNAVFCSFFFGTFAYLEDVKFWKIRVSFERSLNTSFKRQVSQKKSLTWKGLDFLVIQLG